MVLSKMVDDNFSGAVEGLKKGIQVNINFGIKDLDRDGVGSWDPEDIGKLVWDDDFTVAPVANQ